ncbi:hypothetical protein [Burkholderia ambifaria]|uniref:hypothetical protein n=1 Tax=Burkholderia ambifaria TaxID=152480 RepID=UPI00158DB37A|nr:hypothetical protein [Burkholderia ambifaria]
MRKLIGLLILANASLIPIFALAETNECIAFLKNPVFTSITTNSAIKSKDGFRQLQCSAQWKSASDAESAGIDATIPVYDISIPLSANWDQSKVEQWKQQNCSQAERDAKYETTLYQSAYAIDPITAKAAVACMQSHFATEQIRALRCTLTETNNALLFQAEWRRSPGEDLTTAPKVVSFSKANTICQNAGDLEVNKQVPEGGISLLCSVQEQAAAFSLNTNRGQCIVSATPRMPKVVLPTKMVLDNALFIASSDVEIPSGAKIITNGYPVTINADRLSIGGSAEIRSFASGTPSVGAPGRYAGSINITAKDISGKGLTILNAGEPGGQGLVGSGGPPGGTGNAGKSRLPAFQQNCGGGLLNWLCQAVPAGCTGGEDGGKGGTGAKGYAGNPGAPGGAAGEVRIDFPIDGRDAVVVLTDVDLAGKPLACSGLICGGIGGKGGDGGPGGPGGVGGSGAHGTMHCGGTNDGPTGEIGPKGDQGPKGADGASASLRFL